MSIITDRMKNMENTPLENHYKAWVALIDEVLNGITRPAKQEEEEEEE